MCERRCALYEFFAAAGRTDSAAKTVMTIISRAALVPTGWLWQGGRGQLRSASHSQHCTLKSPKKIGLLYTQVGVDLEINKCELNVGRLPCKLRYLCLKSP